MKPVWEGVYCYWLGLAHDIIPAAMLILLYRLAEPLGRAPAITPLASECTVCMYVSMHTSQVAHNARAHPGFRSNKGVGVFLLPPPEASPLQGYPQHQICLYPFKHLGGESTVRVKCLAQEHNTIYPAKTQTLTTRSGVDCTKP